MTAEPSEHAIQIQIMEYLALKGIYVWRNNTGVLPSRRGVPVHFGKVGSADILGVANDGRIIALEIKRPSTRNDVTPAQRQFLDAVAQRGGYAGVVCSVEEVDKILRLDE